MGERGKDNKKQKRTIEGQKQGEQGEKGTREGGE